MSLKAVNRVLRRRRSRLAVIAAVIALAGSVAVHHIGTHDESMGGMDMTMVVICLAVLPVVALAAAALGGLVPARPGSTYLIPWAPGRLLTPSPLPRARSSPVATVVLRC